MVKPFHDCPEAIVAAFVEPAPWEFYIMIGEGDHDCVRFRLSESLLRKLRRDINELID